jgi:Ni/Fe-hydrogenase 1 B-type cytochrome subunit
MASAQQANPAVPAPAQALPERYERVYVWQWPIRIFHWVVVASIVLLFATGLLIANPIVTATGEPSEVFVHARVRQLHFIAAFVFAVAYAWRLYWFLMGNRFARTGFPFVWRASWWRDLVRQAYDYLRFDFGTPHLGHNSLGGLSYLLFVAGLGLVQIGTGFALYAQSAPGGFLDGLFGWILPLLGGAARTQMWHHLAAWGFPVFAILHVYIVMLDARQYRNGLLISMITGHKFRRARDRRGSADEE